MEDQLRDEHKEPHITPLPEGSEIKRVEDFYSPNFLSEEELLRAKKMGNFDGSLTPFLRHIAALDARISELESVLRTARACMKAGRCFGCEASIENALNKGSKP